MNKTLKKKKIKKIKSHIETREIAEEISWTKQMTIQVSSL